MGSINTKRGCFDLAFMIMDWKLNGQQDSGSVRLRSVLKTIPYTLSIHLSKVVDHLTSSMSGAAFICSICTLESQCFKWIFTAKEYVSHRDHHTR